MQTIKFKTNIKCAGCIAKNTPFLNEAVGEDNWEVDVQSPDKTLTVVTDEKIFPEEVIKAVKDAGYSAVPLAN